jgi:hypothetical protein
MTTVLDYLRILFMSELERLFDDINSADAASKSKSQWQPEQLGEIDIRIAADGSWYHQGRKFQRDALVKLFAGILRREDDAYFLVTPVEKLRIQVDDAPFVATLVESMEEQGRQFIIFTTNIDERIILDQAHDLRIEVDAGSGQPRPYVHLRAGLEALISRSAFYDLVNMAVETRREGNTYLSVTSDGEKFELGRTDE